MKQCWASGWNNNRIASKRLDDESVLATCRRITVTGLIVIALLIFALRAPRIPRGATFYVFGGLTSVEVRGAQADTANAAFVVINNQLHRDERAWHPWQRPSALMDLNDAIAQGKPYRAPPELAGLLRAAQRGYADSDGLFDPAIGALISACGFHTCHGARCAASGHERHPCRI